MNRIALLLLVVSVTVSAAEDPAEAVAGPPPPDVAAAAEQAAIADALNNPLSSLWIMFAQNDTTWYKGDRRGRSRKEYAGPEYYFNTTCHAFSAKRELESNLSPDNPNQ
jgi:hypothetical protein